jgi:hypothetical protein
MKTDCLVIIYEGDGSVTSERLNLTLAEYHEIAEKFRSKDYQTTTHRKRRRLIVEHSNFESNKGS